jgi:DeoR/GlpR family transcriptional regulator of sugar metabolism
MQLLNERERKVLDLLIEDPHIGVNQMSKLLDVSVVTVRSDFDDLADKGYLIRTRGGALPAFHPDILARQKNRSSLKTAIAKTAAGLIEDGDTIMIEAGTTTALIGRYLLGKKECQSRHRFDAPTALRPVEPRAPSDIRRRDIQSRSRIHGGAHRCAAS